VIWRAVVGIVVLGVGTLWIAQGVGAVHGSFMTGHGQYTAFGAVLGIFGLVMIGWAAAILRRKHRSTR
jgi:Na+/melibiose symporter-like transporter